MPLSFSKWLLSGIRKSRPVVASSTICSLRNNGLWGAVDTIKHGLRAHFTAGATHVCVQPVHDDNDFAACDRMLKALADT